MQNSAAMEAPELGDRTNSSIDMPETPGPMAQTDAERDAWEKAAANAPDVTNQWVPDGYQITRNKDGLAFCTPQPSYIAMVAKQAPTVMDRSVSYANSLLGEESGHKEASAAVNEALKDLLRVYNTHNLQFAFVRNLVYAQKNAAVYQAVVLTEQLDQLQRQVTRAAARGTVSDNPSVIRARSFADQTLTQLYVATQSLQVFDPKDRDATFATNWERTATSYCNKRGENFTRSVLHKQSDPKLANTVDMFDIDVIAKLTSGL